MSGATAELPTESPTGQTSVRRRSFWSHALRRLGRQPLTVGAIVLLVALFIVGALANQIDPEGWNSLDLSGRWRNHAPTLAAHHFLGTDNLGRDVLVRTLWGLHYTEQTALVGALIATLIGTVVGVLAGFSAGRLDAALMRFADLVAGIPVIVLIIALFVYLHPVTVWEATIAFALSLWTLAARIVRARIATLMPEEFVQAARGLGASDVRIVLRHLLPNAAGTIIVAATSLVGQILLIEATAEFFGFGVASLVRPTLGNLLAEVVQTGIGPFNALGLGWWTWVPPAALLTVILTCVNFVGDGLDAALNPRTRARA
jgi:peptide/nickel transport system permease protein